MTTSNTVSRSCRPTNSTNPQVYSEQRWSIVSIVCRICYDNERDEPLITPCRCKGTVAFVHRSCLETWLAESNTTACELCHQVFKTERSPKYSSLKSIWKWVQISPPNQRGARGVKGDLLACGMLTPIAILITYVCLFSSDYYNQKKFSTIPAARWTSISLLFMIAIMLIGYYLWVYSVIRLHARMWYNWWQRECVVKYVPPSTVNICPNCPSSVHTPNNTPMTRTGSAEDITDNTLEPRVDSVFQLETEETELHDECFDKADDNKQKSSNAMSSSDCALDIEETPPFEAQKTRVDGGPLSMIKNKGTVYIINFGDPTEKGELIPQRSNTCLTTLSSISSDDGFVQVHSSGKIDAEKSDTGGIMDKSSLSCKKSLSKDIEHKKHSSSTIDVENDSSEVIQFVEADSSRTSNFGCVDSSHSNLNTQEFREYVDNQMQKAEDDLISRARNRRKSIPDDRCDDSSSENDDLV